ncbi:MAG: hydroxyacid dehydrogenase [Parcubacteria group bacterium]|nr:hydroxyacid dehydrogenase [Parcubacteria group bacterium]
MKIAIFETKPWEKKFFNKALKGQALAFVKEPISPANCQLAKDCEIISTFISSKVNNEILNKLPKLKMIATRSTGFDHIDLKACKNKNIAVCNVPFYGENTVAEHAFALILTLSRNIHKAYLRTTRGDYSVEGLKGFDLRGKTLGVIGAGHIGLHLVKMGRGFDMKVLAFDNCKNYFQADFLGFKYVSLAELLKNSDIISLHVPDNQATHHLINKNNIKLIKKGAILINTARGGVVETEALIEALDKKILAGAGLDVLEGENLVMEEKQLAFDKKTAEEMLALAKDHILFSRDNVIFTPHIAFYSEEAIRRIMEVTADNIKCFMEKNGKNTVL